MIATYAIALLGSLALSLLLTPFVIKLAPRIGAVDNPSEAVRKLHQKIMPRAGGIVIALIFVFLSFSLFPGVPTQAYWGALIASSIVFLIGLLDDIYRLSPWLKLAGQLVAASIAVFGFGIGVEVISNPLGQSFDLTKSVVQIASFQVPVFGVAFSLIWLIGMTNTINFLDGLDGLAILPTVMVSGALAIFAYVAGHAVFSKYLGVPYIPGAGELAVFCLAISGAGLAFLWFNAYPAEVFMGDVGALALGAALGTVAVIIRQELVLFIMGGVFVVEAVSVMLQVSYFKYTKRRYGTGQRILLMAPLHHHFEQKGWKETQVVVRFWIITMLLVLIGLATLKLR
jgi:phospho-N-acetylmuramoyl-pentapeptide-transferase